MTKRPYEAMAEESKARLDDAFARVNDLSHSDPSIQIGALRALVMTLESALVIQSHQYRTPPSPEPYPGARRHVLESALRCVELARASSLIPPRRITR